MSDYDPRDVLRFYVLPVAVALVIVGLILIAGIR